MKKNNTQQISNLDRKFLLNLARNIIINKDKKNILSSDEIANLSDILKEKRGCFVTLTMHENLRGCIGYILPISELFQAVIDNAYNAAFSDPRFLPVSKDEVDELHIEISVLTIPEKLDYTDRNDLLKKLRPNTDGVIIKRGFKSATFLPQVWEQLPSKEDFLTHLCMKAGLSSNEWESGDLSVETYQAEAFEEK